MCCCCTGSLSSPGRLSAACRGSSSRWGAAGGPAGLRRWASTRVRQRKRQTVSIRFLSIRSGLERKQKYEIFFTFGLGVPFGKGVWGQTHCLFFIVQPGTLSCSAFRDETPGMRMSGGDESGSVPATPEQRSDEADAVGLHGRLVADLTRNKNETDKFLEC